MEGDMSEQVAEATQTDETDASAGEQQADTDWVAEARKWEKRAKDSMARLKEAEPKLSEYDRLVEASKSELERAQESAAEFQRRAEAAERAALINEVALTKGLPATLARRLQGSDKTALEADADELLAQFKADDRSTVRAPHADYSQGSSAAGGTAPSEGEQFAAFLKQQMGRQQ